MWTYPRPSCPDRSFSTNLDNAEIDIRIRRILALRENRNYGPSSIPLRERVVISKVSPLELLPLDLCQFLPFLMFVVFMRRVLGVCTATRGGHIARGCGEAGGQSCRQ
jgi:hypothetical protein